MNRSIVIDELKSSLSNPEMPLAFFYFDHQDQNQQTINGTLSSLLRQLVETLPEIPKSVTDAYKRVQGSQYSLPLQELEKTIVEITEQAPRTYIIIDALDECDESGYRRAFMRFLDHVKQKRAVRLFVTSRPYLQDIHAALHMHPQIVVRARSADLRAYMLQELNQAGVDDIADEILAMKIIDTIINRARGMWVYLSLPQRRRMP